MFRLRNFPTTYGTFAWIYMCCTRAVDKCYLIIVVVYFWAKAAFSQWERYKHRYTNRPARRTFFNWFALEVAAERGSSTSRCPVLGWRARKPSSHPVGCVWIASASAFCGSKRLGKGPQDPFVDAVCQVQSVPPDKRLQRVFSPRAHWQQFIFCTLLAFKCFCLLSSVSLSLAGNLCVCAHFFNHLKMYVPFFDTCVSKCYQRVKRQKK